MTNPPNIGAIIAELSEAQRAALRLFEPGKWYGTAQPTKAAAATKGRLVEKGLVKHDGDWPVSHYTLTPLGLAVRSALIGEVGRDG